MSARVVLANLLACVVCVCVCVQLANYLSIYLASAYLFIHIRIEQVESKANQQREPETSKHRDQHNQTDQ